MSVTTDKQTNKQTNKQTKNIQESISLGWMKASLPVTFSLCSALMEGRVQWIATEHTLQQPWSHFFFLFLFFARLWSWPWSLWVTELWMWRPQPVNDLQKSNATSRWVCHRNVYAYLSIFYLILCLYCKLTTYQHSFLPFSFSLSVIYKYIP